MKRTEVEAIIEKKVPQELTKELLDTYENALEQFRKEEWNYFGNEIGQFIEIGVRIIQYILDGKYTPFKKKLPIFGEKMLVEWSNKSSEVSESYRLLIPRMLFTMYTIRNKRGMIHKNHISPNKLDATVLLSQTKWVLSEIFRLQSDLSFEETKNMIDQITNREISVFWKIGDVTRVLDTSLSYKEQILFLLYFEGAKTDQIIFNSLEISTFLYLKTILSKSHEERLLEYRNGNCFISPLGEKLVEEKLLKRKTSKY